MQGLRGHYGITGWAGGGYSTSIQLQTLAAKAGGGLSSEAGQSVSSLVSSGISSGAAGSGAGNKAAVSGLLSAAGVSTAFPALPFSFIAAAGLTVGAGVVALVGALRKGKVTRKQAISLAKKYGIDDASNMPGFIAKVMNKNDAKRTKLATKYEKKLKRKTKGGLFGKIRTIGRSEKRLRQKLAVIGAVIAYDKAAARGAVAPSVSASSVASVHGTGGLDLSEIPTGLLIGGAFVVAIAILMLKRKQSRSAAYG
jgi:hypothetical protein